MKKLLVLMLVLGITSLASAVYVLENDPVDGGVGNLIGDGEFAAYFVSVIGDPVIATLLYTGSLSGITDFVGVDPDLDAGIAAAAGGTPNAILFLEFADAVDPQNNRPVGSVVSFVLDEGGSQALLTLHDADTLGALGSILVPEPVSLVLLGLGGLFLRRRK